MRIKKVTIATPEDNTAIQNLILKGVASPIIIICYVTSCSCLKMKGEI
jgi:hypothetical protein